MYQADEGPATAGDEDVATSGDERGDPRRPIAAGLLATWLAACGGGGDAAPAAGAPVVDPIGSAPPGPEAGAGAGTAPAPTAPASGTAPVPAPGPPAAGPTPSPGPRPAPPPPGPSSPAPAQAARFLLQAQFAASEADIAAVRGLGYSAWLDQEMDATSQTGWDWLESKGYGDASNPAAYYDASFPGDYMLWHQLMAAPDQVRKRAALALSEFFVVSLTGREFSWRSHGIAAYWDLLSANAFGNFRNLLEGVTLNLTMGDFLNTKGNRKEDPATGRMPDENYARECMQLMTIGLVQLNTDGTPKLDGQGKPLPTYSEADVSELARVFTGWDSDQSQTTFTMVGTRRVPSPHYTRLPMSLRAGSHSPLAASFLGVTIAANTPGTAALKTALDGLFNHPNVGPFFGKQMIQRLVTSNPSPAYVERVAAAFNNNGAGARGDLRAVFRAILLDDEARSSAGLAAPTFGKVREPMLRLAQWARTFGASSASGTWKVPATIDPASSLGQSPLRSPSVFNFFRPGYVPPSTALAVAKAVAPEFQIIHETTVTGYLNFLQGVVVNGVNGDVKPSYARELELAGDAAALVARLNLLLCADQLSAATVNTIVTALSATPVTATSSAAARLNRVAAAVFMVMVCPEYLVQK